LFYLNTQDYVPSRRRQTHWTDFE